MYSTVLLDAKRALDTVRYENLIYKLQKLRSNNKIR